jgi:signal transduction histidine kinase
VQLKEGIDLRNGVRAPGKDLGFDLTAAEVARRKSYLEVTPEDESRLKEAHSHIKFHAKEITTRFYDFLLAHPHTRLMLQAPGQIERLKKLQLKYFLDLTAGRYDLAYFKDRMRVGETHQSVGLTPEWYVGAYLKYLHIVTDVLSGAFGRDQERYLKTIFSLNKVIHLDMGLALDVYHARAQRGLERKTEELQAINTHLIQLQITKRLLSDMIVHDLQSPLAGIQSFLQVLASRSDGQPSDVQEAIEEGLRRCSDLSQMIMNVLHVGIAESGRLEPSIEEIDLAEVVLDVANSFRFTFSQEGRDLSVKAPAKQVLYTDRYLVRRILENLVRNTLRHTPSGTPVAIRLRSNGDEEIRLSVADQGPGIPRELQPYLFDPSSAVELRRAGLRVDTGLGLAFCGMATAALGAQIEVESDGRHGTEVHVVFPPRPDLC